MLEVRAGWLVVTSPFLVDGDVIRMCGKTEMAGNWFCRVYGSSNGAYDSALTDLYGSGSVYGDSTWRQSNSERGGPGSFGYGIGSAAADVSAKSSPGYVGDYNVNKRVN